MIAVLIGHLAAAALAAAVARRLGANVFWVCALAPLAATTWLISQISTVTDGGFVEQRVSWVPALGMDLRFRLDGFGLVMGLLVSGIGVLVFVYATAYFPKDRRDLARFAPALTVFSGAMLGLVLSDEALTLFVCWELTSITSYLLIGYEDRKPAARSAALQALLTTGLGGLALLGGLVLLQQEAGTDSLRGIVEAAPSSGVAAVGYLLVLLACCTKSAQVPFHGWLPLAMAAPTPVSAYLHSATMVKAGVFLLARMSPGAAEAFTWWSPLVVTIGTATMLVGGLRALRATDLKQVLAFGTIGQLGLLVVLFGAGTEETTLAGVVMLVAHALFKAPLFMVVGIIDHTVHTRDLRALSGLGRALPVVSVIGLVAGASMAGLPPLFGFVGKEKGIETLLGVDGWLGPYATAGLVMGAILTVAYTARFAWGAFADKPYDGEHELVDTSHLHKPGALFVAPAALLTVACVVLGIVPGLLNSLIATAATALVPEVTVKKLALWHGFNLALLLSAVAVAGGVLLFIARNSVSRILAGGARAVPSSQSAYERALKAVPAGGRRVAAVAQTGSLRVYLIVIFLTVVALPGAALVFGGVGPDTDRITGAESPLQWVIVAFIAVTAFVTVRARRRFVAVLTVGAAGYGVTALFVVQGAPDLALTQALVETLTVILFVLVLRHLPERFEPVRNRLADAWKLVVSVLVGGFFAAFLLIAGTSRTASPPTQQYLDTAVPEGGGKNVVNVILVDFRAADTVGEITVLVICALGVVGLVQAGRATRRRAPRLAGDTPALTMEEAP